MRTFLLNKVSRKAMKVSYKTFSISRKALLASFLLASSVFTITAMAQTQDGRDFSIDGFAAYEGTPGTNWYHAGGTTGGASGKVVKANTFSELQAYLQAEDPYVVIVDHDISTGIKCYKTSAKTDWGGHIWIDHCEFFNGGAANKDRYDGLLDCKNNVQWLTFSYNYFHDHDKSCLWGKGDSDVFDNCRTISFHHNFFDNIQGSRLSSPQRGVNIVKSIHTNGQSTTQKVVF